ncbi:AAA-ATPase At2g46620-like [Gastrolobium bilobum]|uniref:AAA-ATPase At2g46620-like n=1 Tax=Gastrolobium bilobum TaxID=150636 RepID=UPI002AB0FC76|nr:AAA-ATPase At2g46620-like [Gastrolobium bilobum]
MVWPWATSISSIFFILLSSFLILRFFRKTSVLHILNRWWLSFENRLHLYQSFKIPLYNHHSQENQLYRKILTYLDSLPSVQDSDFINLFSGPNPSDIFLHLDANQTVHDTFLGAKLSWTNHTAAGDSDSALVLRINKKDKRRVFRQYFQHILSVADEIEQRRKNDIKLYMNSAAGESSRWRSVPFTHPASFEALAMDAELKNKVKSDLDQFLKSKQYYHRLGRVWKRSYLLYGASGTGKSSFVAAMAKFLCYDIYDIDISKLTDGSDWKMLLMQTTAKSMIVIEDLDRLIAGKSTGVSISSVLNFMDGIVSCCGEERVMVFTMNGTKDEVDEAVLRPGRVDVHIHFPLCDFSTFKILATSYLGLKEHKLFPQVEEVFQTGARLSPAEIGEIMISNRNSPTRALKTVISALQVQSNGGDARRGGQRLSNSGSGRSSDDTNESGAVICRESVHTVREFRKLYGLLRLGSRKKEESVHSGPIEKEVPRIEGRVG